MRTAVHPHKRKLANTHIVAALIPGLLPGEQVLIRKQAALEFACTLMIILHIML